MKLGDSYLLVWEVDGFLFEEHFRDFDKLRERFRLVSDDFIGEALTIRIYYLKPTEINFNGVEV